MNKIIRLLAIGIFFSFALPVYADISVVAQSTNDDLKVSHGGGHGGLGGGGFSGHSAFYSGGHSHFYHHGFNHYRGFDNDGLFFYFNDSGDTNDCWHWVPGYWDDDQWISGQWQSYCDD